MAALCLRLCLVLGLIGWALGGRAHQAQLQTQHGNKPPYVAAVANTNALAGQCDAVLLSSLSTFVTSGAGYAEVPPARQLGSQRVLNSSGEEGPQKFDPTPPHKPLWPWSQRDVWLFVLSAITLFIAAGGGIGGGAVFVPLFIIVGGFTAAQSVALSNITILGGAVANFIANSTKRHAFRDTPLIDWDLIMVMEPTTMLGALLGSYANKLLPTWFTSCLMAALLVFLTYKLLMRGVSTFIHESHDRLLQRIQHQHGADADLSAPLLASAHDQDAAAAYAADTDTAGARRGSSSGSKHDAATIDGVSAWMDLGPAGDQSAAAVPGSRHSSTGGAAGRGPAGSSRPSQHSSRDSENGDDSSSPSADADVLPVPAGLKPLTVVTPEGGVVPAAGTEGAALQRETPHSGGRAFSVETTPRVVEHIPSQDGVTSPILWSTPSSATGAEAAAAAGSGAGVRCLFSQQSQQKLQHQQERRQALLLPRYSDGGNGSSSSNEKQPSRMCSLCSCLDPRRLQLSTVQAYSRQQLPWQPVFVLFLLSCWVVASDTGKATLTCGSLRYWAVVLSVVPPCLLVTLTVRQWLLARTTVEAAASAAVGSVSPCATAQAAAAVLQRQAGGMIHWTAQNSITYPLICSLAGVFAGLFGVGGGIVKGPLMLELGVLPDVAAATSATMILFTAGSAAIVYVNFGGVVKDYAQALLLLGFVVTLAGQLVATHLVRVLKRRSIIIFAMSLLMLLASVAAVYQMGLSTTAAFQQPPMWRWGTICQRH